MKAKKDIKIAKEMLEEKQRINRTIAFSTKERIAEVDEIVTPPIKGEHLKKSRLITVLRGRILDYIANNFISMKDYNDLFANKNELLMLMMYLTHKAGGELRIPVGDMIKFAPHQHSIRYTKDLETDEVVCTLEEIKK